MRCAAAVAVAGAAAVQAVSQCCAVHTVTVPCWIVGGRCVGDGAGKNPQTDARALRCGWCVFDAEYRCCAGGLMRKIGCTLTRRTSCLECLDSLACLTDCLSVRPSICLVCCLSRVGRDRPGPALRSRRAESG